jgi:hypothetical protein
MVSSFSIDKIKQVFTEAPSGIKREWYLLFPTLIPLSGVSTTCFSSRCDKDSAVILTTGLPDVNPP